LKHKYNYILIIKILQSNNNYLLILKKNVESLPEVSKNVATICLVPILEEVGGAVKDSKPQVRDVKRLDSEQLPFELWR